jgi:Sigma-70, region 4
MVGTLTDRHREVLLRRYGLRGAEPETHAEIGARLGVGEQRSRQLEREALHRLRSLDDGRRLAAWSCHARSPVEQAHGGSERRPRNAWPAQRRSSNGTDYGDGVLLHYA